MRGKVLLFVAFALATFLQLDTLAVTQDAFDLPAFAKAYRQAVEKDGHFEVLSSKKAGPQAKEGEGGYVHWFMPKDCAGLETCYANNPSS